MLRHAIISLGLAVSACAQGGGEAPEENAAANGPASAATQRFANIAWALDDPAAAPGSFRIFLADGTLVMDSCFETYRIAEWRATGETTLIWTEDMAEIPAHIKDLTDEKLTLVLTLSNEEATRTFSRIKGEMLCPAR